MARKLILIFDQYFWDVAYARLLAQQLYEKPSLRIIIILPPHSDMSSLNMGDVQHHFRHEALDELPHGTGRVKVYSLWSTLKARGIYCHAKVHLFDDALLVCGSANINRRSFSCDTELNCAILDRNLVLNHYNHLWDYLFKEDLPSSISFDPDDNWSFSFVQEFQNRVIRGNLIEDPWELDKVRLPNNEERVNWILRDSEGFFGFMSPSSLPDKVENKVPDMLANGTSYKREVTLEDIVNRIERYEESTWRLP